MSLPDDHMSALELLGRVFAAYAQETDGSAVLVGGAATAIYTAGAFASADFDVVASNDDKLNELFSRFGFVREDRARLRIG